MSDFNPSMIETHPPSVEDLWDAAQSAIRRCQEESLAKEAIITAKQFKIDELTFALSEIVDLIDYWTLQRAQLKPDGIQYLIADQWPGCGWQRVWQRLARLVYGLPDDCDVEEIRLFRALRQNCGYQGREI